MKNYMFAFHGGSMPDNDAAKANIMEKWAQWMEGLGKAIVDPGSILHVVKHVSPSGVSDTAIETPMAGYMIVTAADQSAAIEMARTCPILENDGNVEVAQLVQP